MGVVRLSLAAGIFCAVCLPHPTAAQGGFNGPGRYEVTNVHSGKVLDLDRNDQTSVIQFSSRGTDNQVWEIESAGAGFYSLRSSMNGNALEAAGTGNSAPLHATRFDGRSTQQWRIDNANCGNALIVSQRPEGLLFFVFTAPERYFQTYDDVFQRMLYTVRLKR